MTYQLARKGLSFLEKQLTWLSVTAQRNWSTKARSPIPPASQIKGPLYFFNVPFLLLRTDRYDAPRSPLCNSVSINLLCTVWPLSATSLSIVIFRKFSSSVSCIGVRSGNGTVFISLYIISRQCGINTITLIHQQARVSCKNTIAAKGNLHRTHLRQYAKVTIIWIQSKQWLCWEQRHLLWWFLIVGSIPSKCCI